MNFIIFLKKQKIKFLYIAILAFMFLYLQFLCGYKKSESIAIIGAMDCEISEITANLKNVRLRNEDNFKYTKGKLGKYNIIVSKSGVGKVNAGITTQYIIDKFHPKYIINIGVAGSLDDKIGLGDIFIVDKAIQHDFDVSVFGYAKGYMSTGKNPDKPTIYFTDKTLTEIYKEKIEGNANIKKVYIGTIATGDCFVSDLKQKNIIKDTFGAKTVDMESAAIAQTAERNNVPIVVIKNISDLKNDNLKNYEHNEEFYAKELAHTITEVLKNN